MRLATPERIRILQRKLYCKAKAEPAFRFYALYDKIYREDILHHAWLRARENGGASGVDGMSFAQIEAGGVENWLAALGKDLASKTYRPQAVRRVIIPKPGGGERPLGIPTIRDRVVQTAAKLVLEPIFEADLERTAYGYRPQQGAAEAIRQVHQHLLGGYTDVVDADLSKYFDTIPHPELMKSVSRRTCDRHVLHLIRMWLKVPVEEQGEDGTRRRMGGKRNRLGTPQGGVVSPLLANLYMNRFLKHWRLAACGEAFRAHVVNYADDFVILSRGHAAEALAWTKAVMTRLGLTINEAKTSVKEARTERFDFLGYTFGPHRHSKDGRLYLGASPSARSLQRLKGKVSDLLVPGNKGSWPDVRDRLNSLLAGWSAYFGYGSLSLTYQAADHHVVDRVRHFLAKRHKEQNSGTSAFSRSTIFAELGVRQLRRVHPVSRRGPYNEATRKAGCGKSARPV
ncbi:group II intron reverse transcriptase/maturase [Labrys monachus]|uniref:RNA-directed DNA polymerase n=1 Tax=Labrys monachus TaxID=217067 RepID=A0ABU0FG41_9HYPH|nr:group II intron reverse transcriptase/maturase [Labrys monachus]MDQ0391804.1 RNA-directed DNA polymerase [Labrys monachus]MDQ0392226.1 RNA-directed DNA polymerase [Labrys monachus]MDQ0393560.1 RNA-directed DNA polymerase [Labrys monachus]MDQ0393562.1 RNA-directed DNA polymerase [Labrys monachus]MDQ0394829.1 RNA-directed DNA polymerase [Labrys monachus]